MPSDLQFIANFIVNSCWQIVAIVAIAALAGWILRNGPARYRHALWILALVASLVVPLLTATRAVPDRIPSFQVGIPIDPGSGSGADSNSLEDYPTVDHIGAPRSKTLTTTWSSILFLECTYLLFLIIRAVTLLRFWRRKQELRLSATSAGIIPEIAAAAERCCTRLGVKKVGLMRSAKSRVPYTVGAWNPLIVLPDAFCTTADDDRLLSVIGHEIAHVARRDFPVNLLCELIALPISFHPLTFVIKREIDRARELACDELVTRHLLEPKVYARSLLWAANISRHYSSQAFMLSIFDGKILEERIVRLMRGNKRISARSMRMTMVAAVLMICFASVSLSLFSFELQTPARAAITRSISNPKLAAVQEPLGGTVSAPLSRAEVQSSIKPADDRAMAACDAGRRGDLAAIPSLIAMLADDSRTQLIRCWNVGRWSPALQTFKYPSPGEQAALALASFGPPAFAPLSNELDNRNATVRRNAAWAIGELTNMPPPQRSSAVPQLITLLADSDEWVRMAAARALGELHDSRAVSKLVATLLDENWRVRELVVWALSETKDARAVNALCQVLLSDPRIEVRRGAAEALGEIRSTEGLPALRQALNDQETVVRSAAASAISEIEE